MKQKVKFLEKVVRSQSTMIQELQKAMRDRDEHQCIALDSLAQQHAEKIAEIEREEATSKKLVEAEIARGFIKQIVEKDARIKSMEEWVETQHQCDSCV